MITDIGLMIAVYTFVQLLSVMEKSHPLVKLFALAAVLVVGISTFDLLQHSSAMSNTLSNLPGQN